MTDAAPVEVAAPARRGSLRVYLGVAPGAGATYAMLSEGVRRAARGGDVVLGVVHDHGRPNTRAQAVGLEELAPRLVPRAGRHPSVELDVDALLARRPSVVLVDELARRNDPSSPRPTRREDVEVLLDAGIDVVTTVEVTELESLRDVVERITGHAPSQSVADRAVDRAEQIELVDIAAGALARRLAHGNVVPADALTAELRARFRPETVDALRGLALTWLADHVERTHEAGAAGEGRAAWQTRERVVVAVTGGPGNELLVRHAARLARRSRGELVGVHVVDPGRPDATRPGGLEECRRVLAAVGGRYHEVVGHDIARALADFAHAERSTQLVLGASARAGWVERLRGSVLAELSRQCRGVELHVVAPPQGAAAALPRVRRARPALSTGRRIGGWAVTAVGLPLVTIVGTSARDHAGSTTPILAFLVVVLAASALGGATTGVLAAVGAALLVNWYFTVPLHRWTISKTEDLVALVAFVAVAGVVAAFVGANARRDEDVRRARAEVEALARASALLVGDPDPLPALLAHLRATFGLDAATLEARTPSGWRDVDSSGDLRDDAPAVAHLELADTLRLRLEGRVLSAEDHRLLRSFAAQLDSALDARELRREAERSALLDQADELRRALLQSVSHDLRTPLSSIKAGVTSLLQDDIEWDPDDSLQFLRTIAAETDRLDRVIGNLLDMSRVQSGSVHATTSALDVMDVVAVALSGLGPRAGDVEVDVPADLPLVLADAALVDRVLVNLLSNALTWSPPGREVVVRAATVSDRVVVTIVDRGPGIAPADRSRVFEPFQRLGDRSIQAGVGLGLAVARAFTSAMDGLLELEDTPGGGLTAVLTLPAVPATGSAMDDGAAR